MENIANSKGFLGEKASLEVDECLGLLKKGEAFIMRVATFTDFKKSLEQTFGSGANVILYVVGRDCGIRSSKRFKQKLGEDKTLILEAFQKYKKAEGWGEIHFNLKPENPTGTIKVYGSFEAKNYGNSNHQVCYFLKETLQKEIKITETKCIAKNDSYCEFTVNENPKQPQTLTF